MPRATLHLPLFSGHILPTPSPPSSLHITVLYTFKGNRRCLGGKRKHGERWERRGSTGCSTYMLPCVSVIWCACKEDRAYTFTLRSNGPDDEGKRDRFLPSFPASFSCICDTRYTRPRLLPSPVRLQLIRFFIQGCRAPDIGG